MQVRSEGPAVADLWSSFVQRFSEVAANRWPVGDYAVRTSDAGLQVRTPPVGVVVMPASVPPPLSEYGTRGLHMRLATSQRLVQLEYLARGSAASGRGRLRAAVSSEVVRRRAWSAPYVVHRDPAPGYLARRGSPRSPADLAGHDWVIFGGIASIESLQARPLALFDAVAG